jgi:hypothetical protein
MADEPKLKTGLDDALSLEATYYASPIPQSMAVLTILGAVFDKVYFPGVVMPVTGFDQPSSIRRSRVSKAWRATAVRATFSCRC